MSNEENLNNAPKRMSLKKKSPSTLTLNNAGGQKKVQVEVRKKKVLIDPKERKAQLEQEALAKEKEAQEAKARAEAQEKARKEAEEKYFGEFAHKN